MPVLTAERAETSKNKEIESQGNIKSIVLINTMQSGMTGRDRTHLSSEKFLLLCVCL